MPLHLSTPVNSVKRIGPRIAAGLAERGILTIEDLLYHLPFRYEDRLHPKPLSLYNPGDMASLIGEVRGTTLLRTRSGPLFEMTVGITPPDPESDAAMQGLLSAPSPILDTIKCMWFHGTYLKDKFKPGQKIALYGKLEGSRSGNALGAIPGTTRFKMIQPTFEILPDVHATGEDAEFILLEMGRIVPIYETLAGKTPAGSKLTSRGVRRILWTIFKDLAESDTLPQTSSSRPESTPQTSSSRPERSAQTSSSRPERSAVERPLYSAQASTQSAGAPPSPMASSSAKVGSQEPDPTDETLPTSLRTRLHFPTRMEALRDLHFPPAGTSMTDLL